MIAAKAKEPGKAKAEAPGQKAKQQPASPQAPVVNPLWQRLALGVQAKLAVSAPDDPYEREADRVAEQVMRMPEPVVQRACPAGAASGPPCLKCQKETEASIHRKGDDSGDIAGASVPDGFLSDLGLGQPLDAATQGFMEPRFGQDFRHVRVHTGASADISARSVNALAFTQGRDVVFRSGQYAPHTSNGRRLLAHELAHVVQQGEVGERRWAGRLQRKIVVAGKPYTPASSYLTWLKAHYSGAMVEFINSMHNGGLPPDFTFDSFEQMGKEVRVRYYAVQGIEEVHKGCCSYPTSGGNGKLNPTYWDKKGPYQFVVKTPLPSGKQASDAVEAIFASGAGTELECNSTTVAIQYRAMLKALGEAAFNKKFPNGAGVIISPHHVPPSGVSVHPIWEKKLYKQVTISSAADLLPGDWVYFKNISDYIVKHPGGFWTGEHALYLGGGKFRGFGIAERTENELKQELLDQYNDGLPAVDKKALADVPGLQNYCRRPVIAEITK